MGQLLLDDETDKVIGECMYLHQIVVAGLLESVYHEA